MPPPQVLSPLDDALCSPSPVPASTLGAATSVTMAPRTGAPVVRGGSVLDSGVPSSPVGWGRLLSRHRRDRVEVLLGHWMGTAWEGSGFE